MGWGEKGETNDITTTQIQTTHENYSNHPQQCSLAAKPRPSSQINLLSLSHPPQHARGSIHDGYTQRVALPPRRRHRAFYVMISPRVHLPSQRHRRKDLRGLPGLHSPPFPTHPYHPSTTLHSESVLRTFTFHLRHHHSPQKGFSEAPSTNDGFKKGRAGVSHWCMTRSRLKMSSCEKA